MGLTSSMFHYGVQPNSPVLLITWMSSWSFFFIISKFRYSLQFHKDVLYTKAKIKGGVVHIQPWYPCRVTAQHCFKFRLVKLLQVLGKILENNLNPICAKVYAHKTWLCCAGKIWINFSCGLLKKVSWSSQFKKFVMHSHDVGLISTFCYSFTLDKSLKVEPVA